MHHRPGAVNERRERVCGGVRRPFWRLIGTDSQAACENRSFISIMFDVIRCGDKELVDTRADAEEVGWWGGVGVRGDRALSCHGLCVRLPVQVGAEECQLRQPRIQL